MNIGNRRRADVARRVEPSSWELRVAFGHAVMATKLARTHTTRQRYPATPRAADPEVMHDPR